jgi:hypothetical protein
MSEYVVDLSAVVSWEDFIAAFNDGLIRPAGGSWNGNLNAFNDYLWWPEPHPYRLVIRGWQRAAPLVNQHLTWDNRPVLDVIEEILQDNPHVQVAFA